MGGEESRCGLFRGFPLPDKQSLNYAPLMSFSFFMFRTSHYLLFWGLYLELFRKFNFLRKNFIKKPWGGRNQDAAIYGRGGGQTDLEVEIVS